MNKTHELAILSRDAPIYRALLEQAALEGLHIGLCQTMALDAEAVVEADILLADPDLARGSLHGFPRLAWLQSTWAGNAPLLSGPRRNYRLTGVKDLFGAQMSEYALAYMLYFARDIEGYRQRQQQRQWLAASHSGLGGKTLGILGVGNIGKAVATAAKAMGMRVVGMTRGSRDADAIDRYFAVSERQAFASALDYLLCLLPHTEQTTGFVDRQFLQWLPAHCVLINAGRGSVIDETALMDALRGGRLRAAVLDVFNQEPLPVTHPFWDTPNLLITQHSAALSHPQDIAPLFVSNYQRWIRGEALMYELDFTRGY